MAVIEITEELIENHEKMFEAIKAHYTTFREIMAIEPLTRRFEVENDNVPRGNVQVQPTIKIGDDGEYIIED